VRNDHGFAVLQCLLDPPPLCGAGSTASSLEVDPFDLLCCLKKLGGGSKNGFLTEVSVDFVQVERY